MRKQLICANVASAVASLNMAETICKRLITISGMALNFGT